MKTEWVNCWLWWICQAKIWLQAAVIFLAEFYFLKFTMAVHKRSSSAISVVMVQRITEVSYQSCKKVVIIFSHHSHGENLRKNKVGRWTKVKNTAQVIIIDSVMLQFLNSFRLQNPSGVFFKKILLSQK